MRLGLLRETKVPHDKRVPLTPGQCVSLMKLFPRVEVLVQPDHRRCFSDEEYAAAGVPLGENIESCDVLLGVKEVDIDILIPGKKYLFFSHTAKMQPQNRPLLQEIIKRRITLVDYEYLTTVENIRVVAFGRWAGIVGAYNGLMACGILSGKFTLKPAWQCRDKNELSGQLKNIEISGIKILITGGGRVAQGAEETLAMAGIKKVNHDEYLSDKFEIPVYAQIDPLQYVKRLDGQEFDLKHFFNFPEKYKSDFLPYTTVTDMFIACHYWDPRSPVFFTRNDMIKPEFKIKIVADVSCDLNGPVPSTIRASTIEDPFYGFDPVTAEETIPFKDTSITVMAVDNLPGELPRDASADFGKSLIKNVFPSLLGNKTGQLIVRATIVKEGKLTERFDYLSDYVND